MIILEYKIAEIFDELEKYANSLQKTLQENELDYDEFKLKYELLEKKLNDLEKLFPQIKDSDIWRHLFFVKNHTKKWGMHNLNDIIKCDIPKMKEAYIKNLKKFPYLDTELRMECENLLVNGEFDSAVRKAFVVLKNRAVKKYNAPPNKDGEDLVNYLFSGKSGKIQIDSDEKKQNAFRDLCSSLFRVFRNQYAHNLVEDPQYVTEAILATVNMILKIMDENLESSSKRD